MLRFAPLPQQTKWSISAPLSLHQHPSPVPQQLSCTCAGIPTEAEYVATYCKARSIPPPDAQTWSFFMALSLFRAAAILAGVGARAKLGNASSDRAAVVRSPVGMGSRTLDTKCVKAIMTTLQHHGVSVKTHRPH